MGDEFGDDVFFKLMCWPDGEFRFSHEDVQRQKTVTMDTMGLLMEGMRHQDEVSREEPGDESAGITSEQDSALDDMLSGD